MPTKRSSLPSTALALFVAASPLSLGWADDAAPGTADPVPRLLENLASDNLNVATSAARSLGVVFAPGTRTATEREDVTTRLQKTLTSPKGASLRRESARALGRMRAVGAADSLKAAMADEDVDVATAAAEALASALPVDEARAYLKERGAEDSENVRAAAYAAMGPIAKAEDADFLVAGLDVENWRIQKGAVEGLERAVRSGAIIEPAAYDKVAGVLGAETSNAANAAMHFLRYVNSEECIRATIAAVETAGDGGKEDTTWRTRTYAIRTLRHQGWPRNKAGLPAVIRQLGDRTANVTNEARALLNQLRTDKLISRSELVPILLTELEKAEPIRLRAGIMSEMRGDIEQQYASRIAKVAAKALEDAEGDRDAWPLRARAIELLGDTGYTGMMAEVATAVGDDVPNVRQAAGKSLQKLAPIAQPDQKVVVGPILLPYLEDPVDWRKSAIAARAAGSYANGSMVEPLVALLGHGVLNVRDAAADSLIDIVEGKDEELAAEVAEPLKARLAESSAAWEAGAKVLGPVGDPKTAPLLVRILNEGNWRAQTNAANAARMIAAESPIRDDDLNGALVKAAQSEIVQVQEAANEALRVLAKSEETAPAN